MKFATTHRKSGGTWGTRSAGHKRTTVCFRRVLKSPEGLGVSPKEDQSAVEL